MWTLGYKGFLTVGFSEQLTGQCRSAECIANLWNRAFSQHCFPDFFHVQPLLARTTIAISDLHFLSPEYTFINYWFRWMLLHVLQRSHLSKYIIILVINLLRGIYLKMNWDVMYYSFMLVTNENSMCLEIWNLNLKKYPL